jgi:hypothetical protein
MKLITLSLVAAVVAPLPLSTSHAFADRGKTAIGYCPRGCIQAGNTGDPRFDCVCLA